MIQAVIGFIDTYGLGILAAAALIYFIGGVIKGAIGFALPMISLVGTTFFIPAKTAIALLLIPIFIANLQQALEAGVGPAMHTMRRFWPLNLVLCVLIFIVAGLVAGVDDRLFFAVLGMIVFLITIVQLSGWRPTIPKEREAGAGLLAGFIGGITGGIAGTWGPPVVLYGVGLGLSKDEAVRMQGTCFFLGAVILLAAHGKSGLLDSQTASVGALLTLPSLLGMSVGRRLRKVLNAQSFRKATLWALLVLSLNMLRKGFF